jgi:hypothetical protein
MMSGLAILLLLILGLVAAANAKTSRPDGRPVAGLHPYRRVMGFIMPSRNESIVYFDSYVDAEPLLAYLTQAGPKFGCDISHCLVASAFIALVQTPTMNRFSLGGRLYDRNGVYVSFSMKRSQGDRGAKLAVVKLPVQEGETFRQLCERINASIRVERSGEHTYADKEFGLLSRIPRPALWIGVRLLKTLDYYNLLPASFIENDPLYTSLFCANLGSLQMGAGYHHLYEWGTCSLFVMAGQIEERPVVRNGVIEARRVLHLRYSYDERIDDGLNARFGIAGFVYGLEHPFECFGCLAEDGSDARPMSSREALPLTGVSAASATRAA